MGSLGHGDLVPHLISFLAVVTGKVGSSLWQQNSPSWLNPRPEKSGWLYCFCTDQHGVGAVVLLGQRTLLQEMGPEYLR